MAVVLTFVSLLSLTTAQATLNLAIHQISVPQGASNLINPSFAGFGIEPSNLFSFTGTDTPNDLTFNLLDNLAQYTGHPPHLRIGGNTEDYMLYNEDQTKYAWITNPNSTGQGNIASDSMLIGPKYFECANRFPQGSPVTWGLNLAYQESDYEAQLLLMASKVVEGIPNLKLVSIEIGNEPDLYLQNGFRTGAWNGQVYSQQWVDRAQFIWTNVLKPLGLPSEFFEPGATASTIGTSFMINDLNTMGAAITANDSQTEGATFVSSWNQHDYFYFISVSTYPLTLEILMTLSQTEIQFAAWVTQIQQAETTPYPYALREMCSVGPIGAAGISDTFGAALWTLNFLLYAASLNITSVEMHQTDNSNASAWQPIHIYDRAPFVRPNYYAWAAFDQIIGQTCQAQITALDTSLIPSNYSHFVRAYRVDQAGQFAAVVVINTQPANSSVEVKPSLAVALSFPTSLAGSVLHLAYLNNTGADAAYNTTWNGISFEESGDGLPTVLDDTDETVTIASDGTATLTVRDSQALAANVGARVGAATPNSAACAAFASKSPGLGPFSSGSSASSAIASAVASASASPPSSGGAAPSQSSGNKTSAGNRLVSFDQTALSLLAFVGLVMILL